MGISNSTAGSPEWDEHVRNTVREWAERSWGEPCGAIYFRWARFSLRDFEGRMALGAKPLWFRIGWPLYITLCFPVLFVYGWIRSELQDAELIRARPERGAETGMIHVEGTKRSSAPTSLIDSVKRAPRDLWIVFSRSRLMIVVCRKAGSEPRVVWQTDDAARLRFNHAARDSIEITWPDKCRAAFYPTFEERKVVTEFVRATWNDHEGRRG